MKRRVSLLLTWALLLQLVAGLLAVEAADNGQTPWKGAVSYSGASVTNVVYTPPVITPINPVNNASGVALDQPLILSFDKPVELRRGNVTIRENGQFSQSHSVASSLVQLNPSKTLVTISHNKFAPNKRYTVEIDEAAFIAEGDQLSPPVTNWSFTTIASTDTTSPTVTQYTPASGTNTGVNTNLTINFNKVVYPGSGNITIKNASTGAEVEKISVNDSRVTGSGSAIIQVRRSTTLSTNTSYYVNIDRGAFVDAAGNSYAGISNTSDWWFRVATDTNNPVVSYVSPSSGSSNVAIGANLEVTFNKEIQLNVREITIQKYGTSYGTIKADVWLNTSDRRSVTIKPRSNLEFNTTYYIEIPRDFVRDLSGNPNDAWNGSGYWSFTTTIQDNKPPVLQSAKMYNNNSILLQYNKTLDSYSEPFTSSFSVTVNDESRSVSGVSMGSDRVYVNLSSGVAVGQIVKISYTPGTRPIQDLARNKASSLYNQAVTNTVDTTLPKITSGYVSGRYVSLTFSESLKSPSYSAVNQFTIKADGNSRGISSMSTSGGTILNLTLDSPVSDGEVIQVSYSPGSYPLETYNGTQVSAISDFFIRNSYDTKPPVLKETKVSGNKLVLTYNKALDASSIPMNSHFSVLVNDVARYVTKIEININKVELTLASTVTQTQKVTVSYAPGSPRLRDLNGNYAPALNLIEVGNTTDLDIPSVKTATWSGDEITLTLSKKVLTSPAATTAQFTVRINNTNVIVSSITLNTDSIVIKLPTPINTGSSVYVSYMLGNYPIKDQNGNAMKAFTNLAVTNQTGSVSTGSSYVTTEQGYSSLGSPLYIFSIDTAVTSSDRSRGGKDMKRYTIDKDKLKAAFLYVLSQSSSVKVITFNVPTTERAASVAVPLQTLEEVYMQNQNTYISIRYGEVTYSLPLKNIKFSELARQFGTTSSNISLLLQLEKQDVGVTLSPLSAAMNSGTAQAVSDPYEFRLIALVGAPAPKVVDVPMNMEYTIRVQQSFDKERVAVVYYDMNAGKISYAPTLVGQDNSANRYFNFRGQSNNVYRAILGNKSFVDTQNNWAKNDINQLASKFIVEGRTDTTFVPEGAITRGEFATFIVKALGLPGDKSSALKYRDITLNTPMSAYIGAASKAGIITGYTDGFFRPNNLITREQMSLMIVRAMDYAGKGVTLNSDALTALQRFTDRKKVSKVALDAVAKATQTGVIQGMTATTFVPAGQATRSQAVVMIKRMLRTIQYMD